MLDHKDDSVWTNVFYTLPGVPAFVVGVPQGLVMIAAGLFLAWASGRYHTTYGRAAQGWDVSAMLTYLVALGAVLASLWSLWALIAPIAAAPLHDRYVWELDSYVLTPVYIVACLVILGFQAGPLATVGPGICVAAGGAIKLAQPGPRSRWHSLWHVCGGVAATWAIVELATRV